MPFGHLVDCGTKQTQLESWAQTRIHLTEKQDKVLDAVRELGAADPVDVADYLGWDVYVVRPRCTELEQMGLLRDTGNPRIWTHTGKRQTVYVATGVMCDG